MKGTFFKFIDLTTDLDDVDQIHTSINNGISFKGTNLWVLVFAIIIASVGLNTNSTAVIIGAMLISPLMGPINGMGYSIATYDFPLFKRALKNFLFAVTASLATSTIYFSLSPLSTAHSELLARTSPTIYDVLIALFGGLAGIVAFSSKHKGNVIPGVAIATALMPPLCTAGYGLATGQYTYFFGAFYLFTINTVFIALSSILFSQILNFPIRTLVEPGQKKQVNRLISFITAITIIPSIYFGYLLIEKEKFVERANKFVSMVSIMDGSYLLKHEINPADKKIKLIYAGMNLNDQSKKTIETIASDNRLKESALIFEQALSFSSVSEDISEVDNKLRGEINRLSLALRRTQQERDSINEKRLIGRQLLNEIRILFPQISSVSYSETLQYSSQKGADSVRIHLVMLSSPSPVKPADRGKIDEWIKKRINQEDARIVYDLNEK